MVGTDRQLDLLHDFLSVSAIPLFFLLLPALLHLVVGANTNERERRKQTCQNQLAEGSVGNTHTHTYTDTNSHTYTSLTPRRVLLVMSQRKRRYSTSRSASWCPHPTLICTWATTPWLLPFVVGFCYHCCVLHCAQWLCRYAPIHVVVVLCCVCCVVERGSACKRKRERGKKAVPKWKATRK